jgi:hypothetical protein
MAIDDNATRPIFSAMSIAKGASTTVNAAMTIN